MSRVISRYEMREYYSKENGSFLFIIFFFGINLFRTESTRT